MLVFLWVGSRDCCEFDWSVLPTRGPFPQLLSVVPRRSFTLSLHRCNIHNSDNWGMSLGFEPPAGFY